MALERRIYSINFAAGLDQKTDKKLTTKLTTADNVVMRKNGTIEKRTGFVALGTWAASVTANPVKAFSFRDSIMVATDPATDTSDPSGLDLLSASSVGMAAGSWKRQETYSYGTIKTKPLYQTSYDVGQISWAVINASSTQTGRAFIHSTTPSASSTVPDNMTVVDLDGDNAFKAPAGSNANITKSRACSLTTSSVTAVFAHVIANQFYIESYTAGSSLPTALYNQALSVTPTAGDCRADIIGLGSKFYFAFHNVGTSTVYVGSLDPSTGTSSTTTFNASITPLLMTLSAPNANSNRVTLIWSGTSATSSTVTYAQYSATLSLITAPTVLGTSDAIQQIEACDTSAGSFTTYVTSTTLGSLYTSVFGSSSTPIWNTKLIAKPFYVNSRPHAFVHYSDTANQATYVIRPQSSQFNGASINDTELIPVARSLFGVSGGNLSTSREWLPQTIAIDSNNYYTIARKAVSFRGGGSGTVTVNNGVELLQFNINSTQCIPHVSFENSLYLGGGFLTVYDGAGALENGFLGAPRIRSVSTTTTGGSIGPSTGSATYSMVLVSEFTDRSGQVHRSQPSNPVSFNASTSTMSVTVLATEPPSIKNLTRKIRHTFDSNDGAVQARLSVFRTKGDGVVYYRDPTQFTNTSCQINSVMLTASDTTIAVGDVIYTQGGALPNWTPDSCACLWIHGGRLFCEDPSNNSIVRFSKLKVAGEAISFALANVVIVPGDGRVSAGSSLDSNGIIFKQRSIYVFSGEGPDDTGASGSFSDAQLLYADAGCINQVNLCRFKDGIVFKSADKGFFLLTRDLQLQFIGADVEDYNGKTVVSSEVVAMTDGSGAVEECRFLCSDGTLLTYNYYNGQWTTATLAGCTDAVQANGRYVVVNQSTTAANARVFQQSLTTYTDAFSNTSTTYQMTVETGFIKTADVQGFQRIWKVQGLGEAQGGGRISVEVGYDYETSYNETYTFSMASMTTPNYTGGAASAPQFDLVPIRQKCQAIRFRIKDYPTENGAVMKLTNLSLECGVKSGMFKLPAAKGS